MKRILFIILSSLLSTLYNSLHAQTYTLQQCREMALQHSEDMQKAGIAVDRAKLDRQIAFSNYLPGIDGSVTTSYIKEMDMSGVTLVMHGTYMAGITLTQPLYVGGKIHTGNKLAKVGEKVAAEQMRQTRQQVIADVDRAYYSLMAVREKVRMLESLQEQLDGLMQRVNVSVSAEMATSNDALRVRTKQSEIAYNLQKARNGEALCRMALCSAIGLELDTPIEIEKSMVPAASNQQLTTDISLRPELSLLHSAVDANKLQVKMARAEMLPTLALQLGYTYYGNVKTKGMAMGPDGQYHPYSQTMSDGIPMAMLSLQVPLLHWGGRYKKMKQARLDVTKAELDLQKNSRLMTIEVQQAIKNVEDGQRMVQTATLGQQQADENLRVMRLRHESQMATLTDLLEAQAQWQQAHSNLIEAQTQLLIYETEYRRVTGTLEF